MSKEACLTADWHAIGYEDGARGAPVSAITNRRQACAKKARVTANMDDYLAGREAGLYQFCTASNAYSLGSRGGAYYGVCNGPEEREFLAAYQTGQQLFVLQRDVSSAARAIQQAHIDLRNIERDIAATESAMIDPLTPMVDRPGLLVDLKELSREKGRIETAIVTLNRDHVRAQETLADYRDELAYNGAFATRVSEPTDASF